MKPYQLYKPDGEWVDLSAIQSIEPPVLIDDGFNGYTIVMKWHVAFQNEPRRLCWDQEVNFDRQQVDSPEFSLVLDENKVPTALARMRREVFEPLLKAWSEQ